MENLRDLKPFELTKNELDWLDKCFLPEFKKGIPERKIIFTTLKGKHLTYVMISENLIKDAPSRFLKSNLLVKEIPGIKGKSGLFVNVDLLYWYIQNRHDIWNYKNLADRFFYEVFYGAHTDYDKSAEGYRVIAKQLLKIFKVKRSIKKTLFFGYLYFLRLFQKSTILPLVTINKGLKDKTLKYLGLTEASTEAFGKVSHRERLGECWNCGGTIEHDYSGLCSSCYDYWDEKTR
ncbi:MAG: hypothetical protein ACTSQZ_01805 [Candidatus Thorarchaeota archaeon]